MPRGKVRRAGAPVKFPSVQQEWAPIFIALRDRGRSMTWLAKELGITCGALTHYKWGMRRPAQADTREQAMRILWPSYTGGG